MAPGRGIIAAGRTIFQQQLHSARLNLGEGSASPLQSAHSQSFGFGSQYLRSWSSDVAVNEAVSSSTEPTSQSETPQSRPRSVTAILENCPKYALKTEIISFFHSLDLPPDSVKVQVNDRLRFGDWRMTFKDAAQFRLAQEILALKKSIGSRQLRLLPTREAPQVDTSIFKNYADPLRPFDAYRGRALLMFGIDRVVMSDALEKFFEGYQLAEHAFKHFTIKPEFVPLKHRKGPLAFDETRILVKFETRGEALRALKDLHKSMLGGSAVILRLVE